MDRKKIVFLVAAVLAILVLFMVMQKKSYNWRETFKENSKEPFGTNIIYNLLQDYSSDFNLIANDYTEDLQLDSTGNSNFVFIGQNMFPDSADIRQLLDFVDAGNTALISSRNIPYDLMFEIYTSCEENYWDGFYSLNDSLIKLNFEHPDLISDEGFDFKHSSKNIVQARDWQFIDELYFCAEDESFIPIGKMDTSYVNFAKKTHGYGTFYFHTTPLVFSNYHLLEEEGLAYAESVFSHLSDGPIYWDKYSRVNENIRRPRERKPDSRTLAENGPLSYILDQPSLAWAWYIGIGLALLYLIFRAKRKQRIIPVSEPNTNTSMEFISTISQLYFMKNDHKKLCIKKMKLFLQFVRERYHLTIKPKEIEELRKLSVIAEVPISDVEKIFQVYQNIESSDFVSDKSLINFHQLIEGFLARCK